MRVYLPLTMSMLRSALGEDAVSVIVATAVTPALREWYVEGDQDELEYAATAAAARISLSLIGAESLLGSDDVPLRVVLAAEVPDGAATPSAADGRAVVRLAAPVPWRQVESALVDDRSAAEDVRAGALALAAADAGDEDAGFAVDSVQDHELGWYAVQELADLVAP